MKTVSILLEDSGWELVAQVKNKKISVSIQKADGMSFIVGKPCSQLGKSFPAAVLKRVDEVMNPVSGILLPSERTGLSSTKLPDENWENWKTFVQEANELV